METIIDFLNKNENRNINSYFISTDISKENEIIPYEAKFGHFDKFNKLMKVVFNKNFNYKLPLLLLIDKHSQIMLVKNFPPLENYNDDKLFWERMKFLFDFSN